MISGSSQCAPVTLSLSVCALWCGVVWCGVVCRCQGVCEHDAHGVCGRGCHAVSLRPHKSLHTAQCARVVPTGPRAQQGAMLAPSFFTPGDSLEMEGLKGGGGRMEGCVLCFARPCLECPSPSLLP